VFVVLLIFPCTGVLGGPEGSLVFGDGSNVCAHPANTEVYIGMPEISLSIYIYIYIEREMHVNMMRERERESERMGERERDVYGVRKYVSPHIYIQYILFDPCSTTYFDTV
jgi:hypothetical protein